jgi:hypothetical protein
MNNNEKKAQTHCLRGHEFTPENTWISKRGGRECRACRKVRNGTPEKKAAKSDYDRQYRAVNFKKRAIQEKAWRDANPEKMAAYARNWYLNNKDLAFAQARLWVKEHPEQVLNNYRVRTYGLTTLAWIQIFESQGCGCAICDRIDPKDKNGWQTDHDHSCCPGKKSCGKCVRGILCGPCNRGLGALQDSPEIIRKSADYIEKKRKELYGINL